MLVRITYRVEAIIDAPDLENAVRQWNEADCVPQDENYCGKNISYGFVEEVSVEDDNTHKDIRTEFNAFR